MKKYAKAKKYTQENVSQNLKTLVQMSRLYEKGELQF